MTNIFDSSNWPSFPPAEFVSGVYFAFKRDDLSAEFPLSSYSVKFHASQFGTGTGTTSAKIRFHWMLWSQDRNLITIDLPQGQRQPKKNVLECWKISVEPNCYRFVGCPETSGSR